MTYHTDENTYTRPAVLLDSATKVLVMQTKQKKSCLQVLIASLCMVAGIA